MSRPHRRLALVLLASLLEGCSFQLGRPVRAPTERVVSTQDHEEPAHETEHVLAPVGARVRVEAHRLCSIVHTRTVERRVELDRTATHANAAKTLIVIGVTLVGASVVGFVRPQLVTNATKSVLSPETTRILAVSAAGAGGALAIGGASPLLAARRPEVRRERSTIDDPPSPPRTCSAPVDGSGIGVELALGDLRVPAGRTDASGILELSPDALVPRDYLGPAFLVVDGTVAEEIDLAPLRDRRVTDAIAGCRAERESDCEHLARLRAARVPPGRIDEIVDALADHDFRRFDVARCEAARSADDCEPVASFLAWHPHDARAPEAAALLRRGRMHAIEALRTTFGR